MSVELFTTALLPLHSLIVGAEEEWIKEVSGDLSTVFSSRSSITSASDRQHHPHQGVLSSLVLDSPYQGKTAEVVTRIYRRPKLSPRVGGGGSPRTSATTTLQSTPALLYKSFIEENNVGNTAAALMANLAPRAKVLRDGWWREEDTFILVSGDIISIKMGDIVLSMRICSRGSFDPYM